MSLYSQSIKNLIAGISQQPDILRHPEQLQEQQNAMSTEVAGLQKRPPSVHIKKLNSNILVPNIKPLIHTINRDEFEQYLVAFTGTNIRIWDLLGNEKELTAMTPNTLNYITTPNPRKDLKIITIADYTFIVNTTKKVLMTSEKTPNIWSTQGALVNVKSGQYGRTYTVIINGNTVADYTTPDGSNASHSTYIDLNNICDQLATRIRSAGYTVSQGEGWLYITHATINITSVETKDGFNNQAMYGIINTTQKFSNLPTTAPDGFLVKIEGEPSSGVDDYYVQFDSTKKIWKETALPNILTTIDSNTMPHSLVRNSNGTFTCHPVNWTKRKTGDEESNPLPSFIDKQINDLFFFRNRLGIISGENVILSKSADYFQFWVSSAVQVQDTDPIDIAVSHNMVSTLYHAVPFNDELLLFSAQTQFVLRAEGVLSPKNAHIDQVTEFDCLTSVRPVGAGRNVYFPTERQEYTSIKEYSTVQDVQNIKNAQDITAHVPYLIPNGIHKLLSNTTENILLALTTGNEARIYIYKYLFINDSQVQASWSHWDFGVDVKILGGGFIDSTLYLMIQRGQEVYLEQLTFTYNTKDFSIEPYRVYMDRKVTLTPTIYSDLTATTQVNLSEPYGTSLTPNDTYGIVTADGLFVEITEADKQRGYTLLNGDYRNKVIIVGQLLNFKGTFSTIYVKQIDERGTHAITQGRLQLRNFWVNYEDSGAFDIEVMSEGKPTYSYTMTGKALNTTKINNLALESGVFKVPVHTLNTNCTINFSSHYPTPLSLIGAGWDGMFYKRTKDI